MAETKNVTTRAPEENEPANQTEYSYTRGPVASPLNKPKAESNFSGGIDLPEIDHVVARIINTQGAAEGTVLPPRQHGELRVPIISGLKVTKNQSYYGSTQLTLVWTEPELIPTQLSHFNIYVTGLTPGNTQPQGPVIAQRSPAQVILKTKNPATIVLTVQTVLKSGLMSLIDTSPSVSTSVVAGSLTPGDYPPNTIPLSALENGVVGELITWDSTGVITTLPTGTQDYVLTANGANVPNYQALTTVAAKTTNFTADSTGHFRVYMCNAAGGSITVALPAVAGVLGRIYEFKKVDSSVNRVILDPNGTETIDGALTLEIANQYSAAQIIATSTGWSII